MNLACGSTRTSVTVGRLDGLVDIGNDVANVLDADREADKLGSHSGCGLLFHGKLLVGG